MKKILLLIIKGLMLIGLTYGQESSQKKNIKDDLNYEFLIKNYLATVKSLPNNLWLWDKGDFSVMKFNAGKDDGDFNKTDGFNYNEYLGFENESILSIDNTWRFYGKFKIKVSNHEGTNWNLFFKRNKNGSPFRIIQYREGDWNVKNYSLDGSGTKKISDKLSIGLSAKYHGDLYFRMLDTRNEFFNLNYEFLASTNYKLNTNSELNIAASYLKYKSSITIKNHFINPTNKKEYIYSVNGFGGFSQRNIAEEIIINNSNPKLYLGYTNYNKHKFSAIYSIYFGAEEWEYKTTNTRNKGSFYIYDYLENNLDLTYLSKFGKFEITQLLTLNMLNGEAFDNFNAKIKTFTYSHIKADYKIDFTNNKSNLFYKNNVGLNYELISKKDMTNGQKLDYSNIYISYKTGIKKEIKKDLKLNLDIEASYKYNIDAVHTIAGGASSDYYAFKLDNSLNFSLMDDDYVFYAASYYKVGSKVSIYKKLKDFNTNFNLGVHYLKPTEIKNQNKNTLLTKETDRLYLNTSFVFFF